MQISPTGRPPMRADHIGSLLRPQRLRHAFRDVHEKRMDDATFRAIQDEAIRDVVKLQAECGLDVVNDGEYRRGSYWGRFVELTDGLTVKNAIFKFKDDHGHELEFTAPHVNGKVRRGRPIATDEVAFLRPLTDKPIKVTLPSPSTMHFWRGNEYADPGLYDSAEAFFADLSKVFQDEIAALAAAGAQYVQLDEVAIAMLCDPAAREKVSAAGLDPDRLVDLYVDAITQAVARRPANLVVGVHMCRGNFKGKYLAEGGYDSVAERLFTGADVNHFLLEYDTPRAGDFAPLRFVPKNKGVVLGLVSSKVAALESVDTLRRRTDEAAKFIDLDRLGISPQCGFASTVAGNPVTEADERAKLARIVETTRAIWGSA
jgi:5-methyltetrahydropteroyltriglutamate--homocysteine methyltransferase